MHDSLGKDKGYHMSQVHAITTGSSARVQEERLSLFISVQYDVEVSIYQYIVSVPSH